MGIRARIGPKFCNRVAHGLVVLAKAAAVAEVWTHDRAGAVHKAVGSSPALAWPSQLEQQMPRRPVESALST